jgi:hypothetical protein
MGWLEFTFSLVPVAGGPSVAIKDLSTGEQQVVPLSSVQEWATARIPLLP